MTRSSRTHLKTSFGPIVAWYDHAHSLGQLKSTSSFYERVASAIEPPVLDIACGLGGIFQERDGVGCDISHAALVHCAKTYPASMFVRSDAHHLPFKESAFKSVVCLGALEHFQMQSSALMEMHRVLKSPGIALITVTNRFRWTRAGAVFSNTARKQPIHNDLSVLETLRMLHQTGFRVLAVRRANQFGEYAPLKGAVLLAFRFMERVCPVTLTIEPMYVCQKAID